MKLPEEMKNAPWDSLVNSPDGENPLNVSLEVEAQVQQLKSAMKSTRKGRKAAQPGSAVRSSARKRNISADAVLETPVQSKRNKNVMETPLNIAQTPFVGRTPMITPKVDMSKLANTAKRVAKAGEVFFSVNGSPVHPTINPRTKAAEEIQINHAQVPLTGGQTLYLPMKRRRRAVTVSSTIQDKNWTIRYSLLVLRRRRSLRRWT